jgi:hypothetical protein
MPYTYDAEPRYEMGEPTSNALAVLTNDGNPDALVSTIKNEDAADTHSA